MRERNENGSGVVFVLCHDIECCQGGWGTGDERTQWKWKKRCLNYSIMMERNGKWNLKMEQCGKWNTNGSYSMSFLTIIFIFATLIFRLFHIPTCSQVTSCWKWRNTQTSPILINYTRAEILVRRFFIFISFDVVFSYGCLRWQLLFLFAIKSKR